MVSIGIRELRQNASRYVRMAKEGHRIAVTERGTLVAYLVPAGESISLLDSLALSGHYEPPVGNILDVLPAPPIPKGKRPLSKVLQELRDEELG